MPIRIPDALPATEVLESENIFVMTEHRAIHQDIRPLRVLILNLMPLKIETETQILRKLSNTPLQVEVDLLQTVTHKATHVPPKHMESFYVDLDDIRNKRYDGMIVTGAPVEKLPFEDVDYWPELCDIFEWAKTNVFSTLYLCWGAQAGAYYHFELFAHIYYLILFFCFGLYDSCSGRHVLRYPDVTSYSCIVPDSDSSQNSGVGINNNIVLQNRVAGNPLDRLSVSIQRETFGPQSNTLV